MESLLCSRSA